MYESILSDGEETWRHVTTDPSQRHLPDVQYYSLPRQMSHRIYADSADQGKASTLPRRYERSRSDGLKLTKTETETGSGTGGKSRKKVGKSSVGDLQLLETVAKISTAFETESTPQGTREASKIDDVCEPVRGSVGPVIRRGRRSRPSVVAGRRSSAVAVARRGKSAAARRAPSSGRVPPVGAAATAATADVPAGAACWVTCLDSRDSDEDSYVTACNSTPLLSRTFSSTRKDRATEQPDNRKSIQTGNSRRRRRRFKSPSAYDQVEEPRTPAHPERQPVYQETTIMFVPIPVIVILLFLYVVGGAVLFHQLYGVKDWSAAAYISLAAMLTVGGWYPDRRTGDDEDADGKWISWPPDARLVYAVWVVVGLAMVSACLRLTVQTFSHCVPSCRQSTARAQS